MKTLDEIKQLMSAGETAQADEALKKLLDKEPDNLQAKMLYGTCRQLLGDEETFKRIHDELANEMERLEKEEPKAETVSLWKKYHALWMSLIVGGLVLVGIGYGVYTLGMIKDIEPVDPERMIMTDSVDRYRLYACPPRDDNRIGGDFTDK